MSNEALNIIWEHSPSRHIARLVMLSIADRADKYGRAFCSAEDLCRRVNGDRTSVFRALALLRQSGELVVEPVKGPGGCNRYLIPRVAEASGLRRYPGGKLPPPPSQDATPDGGDLQTPDRGNTPPKPSYNPPLNPTEREEILPLDVAIARFEIEYPDKPVRRSLSKMHLQFRRALTPTACREWLEREREAKKTRTSRTATWDETNPITAPAAPPEPPSVEPSAEPPRMEPQEPPASDPSLTSMSGKVLELEFISPHEIDRERFARFVVTHYKDHIASWTPFSAPQGVLRQFLVSEG